LGKTVALVHATPLAVEPINDAFRELYPDCVVKNILDDSLLVDLQENNGEITAELRERLATLVKYGEDSGADAVLLTCSSYSPCASDFQDLISVPFFRADDALLETAIDNGSTVGLIATVPSAVETATRELEALAKSRGTRIVVVGSLCEEAFIALKRGDGEAHDLAVVASVMELVDQVDVIALAQYSIARVMSRIPKTVAEKVISSPHAGVQRLKKVLE
tara:strand:- start:280 stop:939 length:660 start_codon:yes stop_codon:yes gene_type:complete